MSGTGVLTWTAGRQFLVDPTGLVLSNKADGLSVTLGTPMLTATARAAYTGLLLKPESNVSMSAADIADDDDNGVFFAPKRLLAGAELSFPEVYARQTALLFFLAQFDLRSDTSARVSTQYTGAKLSGPLGGALYYDASAVDGDRAGMKARTRPCSGCSGRPACATTTPKLAYARIEIRGLYASGSQGSFDRVPADISPDAGAGVRAASGAT